MVAYRGPLPRAVVPLAVIMVLLAITWLPVLLLVAAASAVGLIIAARRGAARRGWDAPDLVARNGLLLLPESRRDWGMAMLAELDQIERPRSRWRFAAGCGRIAIVGVPGTPATTETGGRAPALVVAAATGVAGLAAYSALRSSANPSSGGRGPAYNAAVAVFCLAVIGSYSVVALRRTRSATLRARIGRRYGVAGGVLVGVAATSLTLPLHLPRSAGVVAVTMVLGVPAGCGALAARSSRDYRSGGDAGLWAGMVGGLILIVGLLTLTMATTGWFAHDPGVIRAYHDALSPRHYHEDRTHYATVAGYVMSENADTALIGGLILLPLLGLLLGSVGGALPGRNKTLEPQPRRPLADGPGNAEVAPAQRKALPELLAWRAYIP